MILSAALKNQGLCASLGDVEHTIDLLTGEAIVGTVLHAVQVWEALKRLGCPVSITDACLARRSEEVTAFVCLETSSAAAT